LFVDVFFFFCCFFDFDYRQFLGGEGEQETGGAVVLAEVGGIDASAEGELGGGVELKRVREVELAGGVEAGLDDAVAVEAILGGERQLGLELAVEVDFRPDIEQAAQALEVVAAESDLVVFGMAGFAVRVGGWVDGLATHGAAAAAVTIATKLTRTK
jgi:hypothetical protein